MLNYNYCYIRDLVDYPGGCAAIAASPRCAFDTETYTLPKYNTQKYKASDLRTNAHTGAVSILTVMTDASVGGITYVFDLICLQAVGYDPALISNALRACQYLIAHNAKFDAVMLSPEIGWLTNCHCTYTLAQIYANATGSKMWQTRGMSLGALCRDWLGVMLEGKGTTQISEWASDPQSRVLTNPSWVTKLNYAAADVKYLFQLHDILSFLTTAPFPYTPLLEEGAALTAPYGLGMSKAVKIETDLIEIVAQMEHVGLPFSPIVSAGFKKALDVKVTTATIYVCERLGLALTTAGLWGDPIPDPHSLKVLNNPVKLLTAVVAATGINLSASQAAIFRRAVDILGFLAAAELNGTSTEMESVESEEEVFNQIDDLSLSAKHDGLELLKAVLDYKKLSKQQSMLLDQYVNPASKRIHPRFSPLRAATSRFACSSPLKLLGASEEQSSVESYLNEESLL